MQCARTVFLFTVAAASWVGAACGAPQVSPFNFGSAGGGTSGLTDGTESTGHAETTEGLATTLVETTSAQTSPLTDGTSSEATGASTSTGSGTTTGLRDASSGSVTEGDTDDSCLRDVDCQGPGPVATCKVDCYFDDDTESDDDDCHWSHHCDPLEPNGCEYAPNHDIVGTTMSCYGAYTGQSATCRDVCGSLVPNGCDCFGCCEIQLAGGDSVTVSLATEVDGQSTCSLEVADDPALCNPCTQTESCLNPCEGCELCFGSGALPAGCIEQTCDGSQPCGLPGQDPCSAGQFCLTGCCAPS